MRINAGAAAFWGTVADSPVLVAHARRLQAQLTDDRAHLMADAAVSDPELADFVFRARDMWEAWFDLLGASDDDFFAQGCGW